MKQWICGANPQLKFTKKGMAYNLNAQNYLATQTSVFLASIYGDKPEPMLGCPGTGGNAWRWPSPILDMII